MKHIQKLTKFFSPYFLFKNDSRGSGEDDAIREVFEILYEYRKRRTYTETLFVETAIPLRNENRENIKMHLGLPLDTRLVEHINPSLASSFQVLYKNKIYTFRDSDRLERLKTLFVHT
jgi:F0F1-type ATP synthase delta subunit